MMRDRVKYSEEEEQPQIYGSHTKMNENQTAYFSEIPIQKKHPHQEHSEKSEESQGSKFML